MIGGKEAAPSATPDELAKAIVESIEAGARILNMSIGLVQPSMRGVAKVQEVLDYATKRGVIPVAAAGNQGTVTSSAITRHYAVIPVTGCDVHGRPTTESNLGNSIGTRGLSAPGENVTSLGTDGKPRSLRGTSVATPFVTGAIALLWSEFPRATAQEVKAAITHADGRRRKAVVPPLLDAWTAYRTMAIAKGKK